MTAATVGGWRSRVAMMRAIARAFRGEWTKLVTVRSTATGGAGAAIACVGLAALGAHANAAHWPAMSVPERANFDPTRMSLQGLFLAQLILGSIAALTATAEWATGTIRSTLAAVPRRGIVAVAKAAVVAATACVAGWVMSLVSFAVAQPILAGRHIEAHLGDPGVFRSLVGGGLYLAAVALLGLGLGLVLRGTAAAVSTLVALVFVLPILASNLPERLADRVNEWLPANAGFALLGTHHEPHTLTPWVGFGVLCGYAGVALAVGTVVLLRRDA